MPEPGEGPRVTLRDRQPPNKKSPLIIFKDTFPTSTDIIQKGERTRVAFLDQFGDKLQTLGLKDLNTASYDGVFYGVTPEHGGVAGDGILNRLSGPTHRQLRDSIITFLEDHDIAVVPIYKEDTKDVLVRLRGKIHVEPEKYSLFNVEAVGRVIANEKKAGRETFPDSLRPQFKMQITNWLTKNVHKWFPFGAETHERNVLRNIRYGLLSGYPYESAASFVDYWDARGVLPSILKRIEGLPGLAEHITRVADLDASNDSRAESNTLLQMSLLLKSNEKEMIQRVAQARQGPGFIAFSDQDSAWRRQLLAQPNIVLDK